MTGEKEKVLVLGGGAAGMEAAAWVSRCGHPVLLVERERELGGRLLQLGRLYPDMDDAAALLGALRERIAGSPGVDVWLNTSLEDVQRAGGGFVVTLGRGGKSYVERVEALILATGAAYFQAEKCSEYGYGRYQGVLTSLDLERALKEARAAGEFRLSGTGAPPRKVAFFQCVGSRMRTGLGVRGRPYCSKICCMYTAKQARELKDLLPDVECYVFYMDVRAAGKGYEEFVRETMERYRVHYLRGRPAKVFPGNGSLLIRAEDTLMGVPLELEVDLVVLAAAQEPLPETVRLVESLQLARDPHGFLRSSAAAGSLKAGEGVYHAGACEFPKSVAETLVQAQAAALQAVCDLRMRERI